MSVNPSALTVGPHDDCMGDLRAHFRQLSVEVTVSTAAPLIETTYTTDPYVCPHGYTYWAEPTSEQVAAWGRDGVR